ncbi:hypothetical protein NDU88_004828 [Pleurodeles waltl]|uniref:Uncharacterized protein n=1 Tax=Pleurodeles waltl TaxID=8319 RepID=A0AAV7UK74_PLEWA|nr:hypothetical protein NDU88_004828 [Pleurodeles waltl]
MGSYEGRRPEGRQMLLVAPSGGGMPQSSGRVWPGPACHAGTKSGRRRKRSLQRLTLTWVTAGQLTVRVVRKVVLRPPECSWCGGEPLPYPFPQVATRESPGRKLPPLRAEHETGGAWDPDLCR